MHEARQNPGQYQGGAVDNSKIALDHGGGLMSVVNIGLAKVLVAATDWEQEMEFNQDEDWVPVSFQKRQSSTKNCEFDPLNSGRGPFRADTKKDSKFIDQFEFEGKSHDLPQSIVPFREMSL